MQSYALTFTYKSITMVTIIALTLIASLRIHTSAIHITVMCACFTFIYIYSES